MKIINEPFEEKQRICDHKGRPYWTDEFFHTGVHSNFELRVCLKCGKIIDRRKMAQ